MSDIVKELSEAVAREPAVEVAQRFASALNGLGVRIDVAKFEAMSGDEAGAFAELSGMVRDLGEAIRIGARESGLSSGDYSKAAAKAKELRVELLAVANEIAD